MTPSGSDPPPTARALRTSLLRVAASFAALVAVGSVVALLAFQLLVVRGLPDLRSLDDYRPNLITRVYSIDGHVMAEFSRERREIVPIERVPAHVVYAFIAAEDNAFYRHEGLDYGSILRAAWANLRAGGIRQGGSTITQQVAKTFLLSSERTYLRKLKDMVLAKRIEDDLEKNEILYLYLNQIYLGSGAYGVQAAAKTYFGKPIEDLTVGEAALIAGLVPAPSRYTPFRNMKAAQTRQHFVLRRMMEEGYLTAEQRASALEEPIVLVERKSQELRKVAAYFAEEVRRYLVERFGPEEVLTGGLQVWTTLNPDNQRAAYEAVREGLRAHDRRRGYRGPVRSIPVDIWGEFLPELSEANGEPPWPDGKRMYGLVVEIDMEENKATLALGSGVETVLRLEDVDWAREPDASVDGLAAKIRHIRTALKPGYLVNLEKTGERLIAPKPISEEVLEGEEEVPEGERMSLPRLVPRVALYQEPRAEGALLSMETSSGHVPAMIGGYSFGRSQFNRAVQGRRQPGSAFKPIIYAAALEAGYTPATIVYDTPIVWKDLETGALWKPGNYSQRFYGPITLRAALARSRNIATIKILRDVGVRRVIEMARTLGIRSPLARDLSLALGSSEVTLTELVRAYATFPSGGRLIDPIFILEVRSRDGELLEENVSLFADELEPEAPTAGPRQPTSELERILAQIRESVEPGDGPDDDAGFIPDAEHVLDPVTAYLMSNMLEAVVQEGTGWRVKALKRPVGGKTGTTNDMFDAWFFGSSPQLVTGVWVGYDSPRNLGKNEAGSRAAGPIFVQYMREALKSLPPLDFEVPPGIEFWRIDRQTGLLASSTTKEAVFQPFREGTAPTEITRTGHTTGPSTPPRLD